MPRRRKKRSSRRFAGKLQGIVLLPSLEQFLHIGGGNRLPRKILALSKPATLCQRCAVLRIGQHPQQSCAEFTGPFTRNQRYARFFDWAQGFCPSLCNDRQTTSDAGNREIGRAS